MSKNGLVWLRRNLRIEDNRVIDFALKNCNKLYFTFVFDTNILKDFPSQSDRRLSFIASCLKEISNEIKNINENSGIIILYGDARTLVPQLANHLNADIYADEDFEPDNITRDLLVKSKLNNNISISLILDHLLIHPTSLVKSDGTAYKVFTPFMKFFRNSITKNHLSESCYKLDGRLENINLINLYKSDNFTDKNLTVLNNVLSKNEMLLKAGYIYKEDELWQVQDSNIRLNSFTLSKINNYHENRNYLAIDDTSRLSPYIRFGRISIRKCYREAFERDNCYSWINELIWREFYANIIFHFSKTVNNEFQEKFINNIPWKYSEDLQQAFITGNTGFPVVDASIRQLLLEGWIHNRGRMIIASFYCKNMLFDWRLGDKFFAKYLMDYDLASNISGWQWTAGTGADAQPYFRIFNPITQGENFDSDGTFIRKYVPELSKVPTKIIHDGYKIAANYSSSISYPSPIIDYKSSREEVLNIFKSIV